MNDLRFAIRQLRKNPGSSALAVLILALGIGGSSAVFSIVDRTILNPIPGPAADRLIFLREVDVMHAAKWNVSPPLFIELSGQTNLLASLAAYFESPEELNLGQATDGVKLSGVTVTPGFFGLLEARPLAGRTFLPEEGKPGHDKVLVASYGLWHQRFAGDPEFVGRTIQLGGEVYTVVGIMPPTFQFPFGPGQNQFWIPHVFAGEEITDPEQVRNRLWAVVGRLRKGVSLAEACAFLDTVAQRRESEHSEPNSKWTIEATMARILFVGPRLEPTLWSLQAAVGILLLIACANVGTLLLARAVARRGELSIRMAIGAGRFRVARQLITESLLLAGLAGLLGFFFAWGGIRALDDFYLDNLPRMRAVGLDGSVVGLTLLVSTATGVVFGVAPAWMVSQLRLHDSLKDTSQQQADSAVQGLFRDGLVVAQVSLAVILLAGAGLVIESMMKLLRVDPGLDPKGLYRVVFDPGRLLKITQPDPEVFKLEGAIRRQAIADWFSKELQTELRWDETMVARLRAIPGVESAAIGAGSGAAYSYGDFRVEGRDDLVQLSPDYIGVRSGDYFHTLRLPLIAGRLLTRDDAMPGRQAVVVSQSLARQCWPGQDPLGKRLASKDKSEQEFTVVGVVKDRLDWRRDKPELPTLYVPVERLTKLRPIRGLFWLRSSLTPTTLRETVKGLGQQMVPSTELKVLGSIESQLVVSTAPRRVYMWLLNAMGGLGLLLSALGIYAVTAYAVVRRTREIGIRMALGASRASIARLVLGRGGRLILNGMILGLAAAFILARSIESLLYHVTPGDPWVDAGVFLVLGTVAGIACWLPARRAAKVDPVEALRHE